MRPMACLRLRGDASVYQLRTCIANNKDEREFVYSYEQFIKCCKWVQKR